MMRLIYLAAFLPTLAFAECPTGADLATGIRVIDADDASDTYKTYSEHMVESQYRYEPGEGARSLLAQGVYLVLAQDIENGEVAAGTRSTFTYPVQPGQMPMPEPGGQWVADVVLLDDKGLESTTHQMSFGQETQFALGACSYRMIPIEVLYAEDDGELLYYLPELGFALLGGIGVGADREVFVYTSIEKVVP